MDENGFREFVKRNKWKFSKTMPKSPHEYTIREWITPEEYNEAALFVLANSIHEERFFSKTFKYYYLDGWKYWSYPIEKYGIINRTTLGDYYTQFPENKPIATPPTFTKPSTGQRTLFT
jgi:hypothetical protein